MVELRSFPNWDDNNIDNMDKIIQYKKGNFPAGEIYISVSPADLTDNRYLITLYSADAESILSACLLSDAIKQHNSDFVVVLDVGYFPYSRQDRVTKPGEPFSLNVVSKLLQDNFDIIATHDMHSHVIKSNKIREAGLQYMSFVDLNGNDISLLDLNQKFLLVQPDDGAEERTKKFHNMYSDILREPIARFSKKRVNEEILVTAKTQHDLEDILLHTNFLIFDDIIDGGGTFISLSKHIKEINSDAKITLVASHGIFSAGTDKLLEVIDNIYVVKDAYNLHRLQGIQLMKNNEEKLNA